MSKIYFIGNQQFLNNNIETCSVNDCINYIRQQKVIGIDIETTRKFPKNKYNEDVYKAGLDPYLSNIIMLQIGTLEKQFIIDVRDIDISFIKVILEDKDILKVGHNLKFEGKYFLHHINSYIENLWDTMICEKILYNGINLSYSLESLCNRYLNIKSIKEKTLFSTEETPEYFYEDEEEEFENLFFKEESAYIDKSIRLDFINQDNKPFSISQIEYGSYDIIYPLKIYELQKQGRIVNGELYLPTKGFEIENKFTQVLALMEITGISFDSEKWLELSTIQSNVYKNRIHILNTYIVKNYKKFTTSQDLFSNEIECSIQWSSSKQVIELFKYLKICPKEKSKQTNRIEYSVSAKALFKLLPNNLRDNFIKNIEVEITNTKEFILMYLLMKKSEQASTTFGSMFLRYVHPITKKIHSNYKQIMNTGRMSSTSPNLQNIPSEKIYRQCFKSNPNKIWVNADFSAQESRILADISKVPNLINFFKYGHEIFGTDMHSFAATQMKRAMLKDDSIIITKDSDPKSRNIAKSLSFALAYGASAFSVKDTLNLDIDETEQFIKAYFDGFPGLEKNFTATKKLAVKNGWIELDSYSKKRYFFDKFEKMNELKLQAMKYYPDNYLQLDEEEKKSIKKELQLSNPELSSIWKNYMILKGNLERRGLNFRIQGNASTMSKIAALIIFKECKKKKGRAIINIIHDEIIGECDIDDEEFYSVIPSAMKKAGTYTCNNVPMDSSSEISNYWKH